MSDELEELRKKRMSELQNQVETKQKQEEMQKQVEAQRQLILQQILEPEARQRLTTLKLTRNDLVISVEDQLIQLAQAGRIRGKINDEGLKKMLKSIVPQKRESQIRIQRK